MATAETGKKPNVLEERVLTLRQGGKLRIPVSEDTLRRWAYNGIPHRTTGARVFLETAVYGGRVYTSHEAVDRFNAKLNAEG